jgi:hypothetical protein
VQNAGKRATTNKEAKMHKKEITSVVEAAGVLLFDRLTEGVPA